MEVAHQAEEDFDKENVAPPIAKGVGKTAGHASVPHKPSDDDSTDCFIVESSNSEESARVSPLPAPLSPTALAQVEGKDGESESVTVTKKKRKKKKKKKKSKQNGVEQTTKDEEKTDQDLAEGSAPNDGREAATPTEDPSVKSPPQPEVEAGEKNGEETEEESEKEQREKEELDAEQERDQNAEIERMEGEEKEEEMEKEEGELELTKEEVEMEIGQKEMEKETEEVIEPMEREENEPEHESEEKPEHESEEKPEHESEEKPEHESAEKPEHESEEKPEAREGEEGVVAEANLGARLLALDTAVLAVVERPRHEVGSSSESEPEHRPVYDEEYVTVDEEGPGPLAVVPDLEDGEVDDDLSLEPSTSEEPFVEPSAAMTAKIVKQIEFYFSDANILKDYFLLRRIRKNRGGWVRIALLAGFKLVQSITKDARQVAFAIKHKSSLLETDEAGVRVRRRGGLPEWDHHVYKRTCLVYGFDRHPPRKGRKQPESENVSVQFVRQKLFSKFDSHILLVRILKSGKEVPLDLKTCVRNHPQLGQELCVVAEFDTVAVAEAARSFVDGRRWSQSHRLWAKILGKRPRLPEEWAARFGADRLELLHQQQQHRQHHHHPQHWAGMRDLSYQYHQQQQMYYQQQLLQQLYYQQQQQKFLEDLQKRRWGDKRPPISYADSVRGKKRPAPESYADKVRSSGKSEPEGATAAVAAAAAAAADAGQADEESPGGRAEKRKLVPRLRAQPRSKKGQAKASAGKATESAQPKTSKPKASSYAAAAASPAEADSKKTGGDGVSSNKDRERHPKSSEAKDSPLQTGQNGSSASPAAVERKERTGFILVREPRGPMEGQAAPTWIRNSSQEATSVSSPVPQDAEEAAPSKSGSGLARRRSVRELVRQFEALTASANDSMEMDPGSGHSTPRRVSVGPTRTRDSIVSGTPLTEVPEQ